MLSRRKKQNLLYLGIGIVTGVVVTALVAYFGVISNFTKESIGKISEVFPNEDTTAKVVERSVLYEKKPSSQQAEPTETVDNDTASTEIEEQTVVIDTAVSEKDPITIKTDIKIAEALISITCIVKDTTTNTKSVIQKGELLVEQWENPTNFAGYRKTKDVLVVYGIDIDNIELQLVNNDLYLIYHEKKLLLKDSDDFLHYPPEFIK
jgi:hypothetical protein